LKGARRYEAAIKSNSRTIDDALQTEIVTLHEELKQLIGLRVRTESGASNGRRIEFQGSYSRSLSIDIQVLGQFGTVLPKQISIVDCRSWRPSEEFDLIITDPPYGFNTIEDRESLAEVYSSFLRIAVRFLKDGGQLILALPDWSHTGRRLPAFILKDFITHQILVIAEEEGREVINSADQIPETVPTAPYYWESEKALRRAILHFRFRKRAEYRRKEGTHFQPLTAPVDGGTLLKTAEGIMSPAFVERSPRLARAYEQWGDLTDEERKILIPFLLSSMRGWQAWSITDSARLGWLEDQFEQAGVPFRGRSQEPI
jgi:hypothetical protein